MSSDGSGSRVCAPRLDRPPRAVVDGSAARLAGCDFSCDFSVAADFFKPDNFKAPAPAAPAANTVTEPALPPPAPAALCLTFRNGDSRATGLGANAVAGERGAEPAAAGSACLSWCDVELLAPPPPPSDCDPWSSKTPARRTHCTSHCWPTVFFEHSFVRYGADTLYVCRRKVEASRGLAAVCVREKS